MTGYWASLSRMVAAVCLTVVPVGFAQAADAANLKLLTWNIQMLPTALDFASPDLQKGQALRAPWIIEHLNQCDYDVVVLQEVIDKKIAEQLQAGLKAAYPHVVFAPAKLGLAGCSGGNLIVGRVPLKHVAHTVFKNITGVDKLAEKGCLVAETEIDGIPVQIIGAHLQAGDDKVNEAEYAEIREGAIQPHGRPGMPQILAGDMNVAAGEAQFDRLLSTVEMAAFPLDDPNPFTVDGKNSWNKPNKRPKHIDHVLLSPRGTKSTVVRQTVQRARREHQGRTVDLADHYGVIAEIRIAK